MQVAVFLKQTSLSGQQFITWFRFPFSWNVNLGGRRWSTWLALRFPRYISTKSDLQDKHVQLWCTRSRNITRGIGGASSRLMCPHYRRRSLSRTKFAWWQEDGGTHDDRCCPLSLSQEVIASDFPFWWTNCRPILLLVSILFTCVGTRFCTGYQA